VACRSSESPGPVVTHCGAWIGGRGGFLNVSQRDSCIQRCGDECVPQRMGPDGFGDPGAAGDAANQTPGTVPVTPGHRHPSPADMTYSPTAPERRIGALYVSGAAIARCVHVC
jgi:hypothetical protein